MASVTPNGPPPPLARQPPPPLKLCDFWPPILCSRGRPSNVRPSLRFSLNQIPKPTAALRLPPSFPLPAPTCPPCCYVLSITSQPLVCMTECTSFPLLVDLMHAVATSVWDVMQTCCTGWVALSILDPFYRLLPKPIRPCYCYMACCSPFYVPILRACNMA